MQEIYESRYVAYIDILGFKNLVNEKSYSEIKSIISFLAKMKRDNDKRKSQRLGIGEEISLFSDSLIISYPEIDSITKRDNLFHLIIDLMFLQFDLAFNGVFIRGGICKGSLYHNDDICFGQGLIDAYNLESNDAIYPRIIVSNDILQKSIINEVKNDLRTFPVDPKNTDSLKKFAIYNYNTVSNEFANILFKDTDGWYYINFMIQGEEFDEGDGFLLMLETIKKKTEEILKSNINDHIKAKYYWLQKKLFESIKSKKFSVPIHDDEEKFFKERIKALLK